MTVSHNGHNTWKLHIGDVQRNDSGHYMCQINTEPMVSQIGMLEVVEAPDILYNETSNDTITMEGASVNLRCEARGYPEPTITWQREDKQPIVIRDTTGGSMKAIDGIEGNNLVLTKLTRADGGAYLCIAQNGVPSPVSKRIMIHVHFHPSIQAKQNLVSTIAGSEATLECKVEASPKSVNYWLKINPNPSQRHISINTVDRFTVEEIVENSYTQRMRLRINDAQTTDFGTYACVARNSLGEVQTNVQLQEMKIELSSTESFRESVSISSSSTIHQEISTLKRKRKEGRRRKGKGNKKGEDHVDTWEHNQHSFVSLEEKDKFGDFESFYQPTYPGILITTEHYNYHFRNTWNSSLSSKIQFEFVSLIFLLIPFIW